MRFLGEAEDGQVTFEVSYDLSTGEEVIAVMRWEDRDLRADGVHTLPVRSIKTPISNDPLARLRLIQKFAQALDLEADWNDGAVTVYTPES